MKLTTNHIVIAVLALLLLYKCNEKPRIETITAAPRFIATKTKNIDSLQNLIKQRDLTINAIKADLKRLSLKTAQTYTNVILLAPDTCHDYINQIKTAYEEESKLKDSLLTQMEKKAVNLESVVSDQKEIINAQIIYYEAEIRKYKRSRIKWFGAGFGIGYLTGKIL
jgi:hypothetical protein